MKIVIAVDSFKGTLSSVDISRIIKSHYEKKGNQVLSVPLSDGGEGFIEAIKNCYNEKLIFVDTSGPLGDCIKGSYIIHDDVAFIELSSVSGINTIEYNRLNPLLTSTYGLGSLVLDAIDKGVKKIVLGIGGSATNDGGAGMLQALGVKYYNQDQEITSPINGDLLGHITSFETKLLDKKVHDIIFEIASDVENPLLGEHGCAFVYAKQKGATEQMQEQLEKNMTHYAQIAEKHFGRIYRHNSGAGAAGGFGFGAMAFLNANMHSGIDYMIELLNIESYIENADIVFVGEGKLDQQTLYGKAPYGIAKIAKKHNKKVIGIFAMSDLDVHLELIDELYVIVPTYADQMTSMNKPEETLIKMLEDIKID